MLNHGARPYPCFVERGLARAQMRIAPQRIRDDINEFFLCGRHPDMIATEQKKNNNDMTNLSPYTERARIQSCSTKRNDFETIFQPSSPLRKLR